ncbi:hypothetical protein J2X68_007587 [Streptomyces sp. 3330]|nr:hypothetical protein [Streptomyces sp. 3330]
MTPGSTRGATCTTSRSAGRPCAPSAGPSKPARSGATHAAARSEVGSAVRVLLPPPAVQHLLVGPVTKPISNVIEWSLPGQRIGDGRPGREKLPPTWTPPAPGRRRLPGPVRPRPAGIDPAQEHDGGHHHQPGPGARTFAVTALRAAVDGPKRSVRPSNGRPQGSRWIALPPRRSAAGDPFLGVAYMVIATQARFVAGVGQVIYARLSRSHRRQLCGASRGEMALPNEGQATAALSDPVEPPPLPRASPRSTKLRLERRHSRRCPKRTVPAAYLTHTRPRSCSSKKRTTPETTEPIKTSRRSVSRRRLDRGARWHGMVVSKAVEVD